MMRSFLLFLLIFGLSSTLLTGQTNLHGNAPDYAGLKIEILTFTDPVTFSERSVKTFIIGPNGDFNVSLDLKQTQFVFAHVGVYKLYLYAEPQTEYAISLPVRQDKKPEELLNPYFEEKDVQLNILNCRKNGVEVNLQQELNFYIRTFDDYFGPYMSKYALQVATSREMADRDSTINHINHQFPDNDLSFYNDYKKYKIGFLQFMSLQNKSKAISGKYFLNQPILYDNPAYTELFNEVYNKYLLYFGRTPHGRAIYDDINVFKSLSRVKTTLSKDNVLQNDTLQELVILKNIYNGFYSMEFSRGALLCVLDSVIVSSKLAEHQEIGKIIREKVTRLLTGYNPPAFKLYDQEGKLRSLEDFKGKYTYLMFCTTQNYACLTEFELLKKLYEKHKDKLNIVTILADNNFNDSRKFIRGKQLPWTFLHYGNMPEVLKEYDVRALPTYYLIDREGKLAISPAPSPSENFELSFFNELRAKGIL